MEKKELFKEFSNLVYEDMEQGVCRDLSWNELGKYDNIVLLCSASDKILCDFLENIVSHQCNIILIGRDSSTSLLGDLKYNKFKYHLIKYNKRFEADDFKDMEIKDFDAICFLGYTPHKMDYLNVEEVCRVLSTRYGVPVYAYMLDGNLCRYADIDNHINAMNLYNTMMKWLH